MYAIAVLQSNAEQACLYSLQLRVVYAATPRVRLSPGVQQEEVLFRHILHSSFSSTVLSEQHEQVKRST